MGNLQDYYDEHAAQARQHEEQRERATNLILTIAGLLVGLITFSKLSLWSAPAAVCIVGLGAIGFLFAGKHYERFRFHTSIMEAIRSEIEQPSNPPKLFSELRSDGESKHYDDFVWPSFSGSRNQSQANATSWIARQRLHIFWESINLMIVVIGAALFVAIMIGLNFDKDSKPLKVEIVSPSAAPHAGVQPEAPASGH